MDLIMSLYWDNSNSFFLRSEGDRRGDGRHAEKAKKLRKCEQDKTRPSGNAVEAGLVVPSVRDNRGGRDSSGIVWPLSPPKRL
jgi:hypothetical protein